MQITLSAEEEEEVTRGGQPRFDDKGWSSYIFLHELCKAHDLQTSGSKQGALDRLTRYFFDDLA